MNLVGEMRGLSPAEEARHLVIEELKLAARAAETVRKAEQRVREDRPLPLRQLAEKVADIHRDSEARHLAAARAHADAASRLGRLPGAPELTVGPVYMSAVAAAAGACNAVLAVSGTQQPEAIVTPSDALARAAHDLEATCGEGPARDAMTTGGLVRVSGDALGARWPLFGPAVGRMGIADITATPLRASGRCLGTVTTLCWNPGGCRRGVPLNWLADPLVRALLGNDSVVTDGDGLPVAPPLDGNQAIVHQAAGMVAGRTGVDISAALDMIRARAFTENQPAEAIAAQIVSGRLDPALVD